MEFRVLKSKRLGSKTNIKIIDRALNSCKHLIDPNAYTIEYDSFFGPIRGFAMKVSPDVKIANMNNISGDDDNCPVNRYNAPPIIDIDFGGDSIAVNIGNKYWHGVRSRIFKKTGECYISYDATRKHESILGILSILLVSGYDVNAQIKEVIYDGLNKLIQVEPGSIELAGMESTIDKCVRILESDNPKLIGRHVLLAGPPGCGKSEVVKAVVHKTPEWIHHSVSSGNIDWREFVSSVDKLMTYIDRKMMVIIDEIDEVGLSRALDHTTVFELLRVMDGVSDFGRVKFIATTNRPADLDPALKRIGRLGPVIFIDKPDDTMFCKIVKFYAERYNADVDVNQIAESRGEAVGCDIRAAFENCIIFGEEISTANVIKHIVQINESKEVEITNYI